MFERFKRSWGLIAWFVFMTLMFPLYALRQLPLAGALIAIAVMFIFSASIISMCLDPTITVFSKMPPANVRANFTKDSHLDPEKYWARIHMLANHFGTDPKATEKYVRKVLAGKF